MACIRDDGHGSAILAINIDQMVCFVDPYKRFVAWG